MSAKRAGIIAAGWGERLEQKIPKALTRVGGRALIDYTLDGLRAAGVDHVTCIINEAAQDVPPYVREHHPALQMDWIVRTTPSSMHSFLAVLERLTQFGETSYFMTTVDSVCEPNVFASFAHDCQSFAHADVCLGLTQFVHDEKPLRVAMAGNQGTGLMPPRIAEDPEAYAIVAMTNTGFDSEYVTAGFYQAHPRILKEKAAALAQPFTALRQYLGHLLKFGYQFYGVPLPPVVDVDRIQDVEMAEKFLASGNVSSGGSRP